MSVKIKDIAEYLNISIATVSRVLNNKDRVDEKTRKRVLDALEKFQYHPNEIARSLKSKNTRAIGLILPDITNLFSAKVFKGVIEVAREHGYYVIFCNGEEDKHREEEYTTLLLQKQISGLIIAIEGRDANFYGQYQKLNIPVVFIDNIPKINDNFDYVGIDNVKASYELTKHLIKIGHKKIAIITNPLNESVSEDRFKGWEKAFVEHNIPVRKKWIGIVSQQPEDGYKAMKEFLKAGDVPTAIFAANNFLAYGAMRAIMDAGLKIPDDIALVCFDAIDFLGIIKPEITSVIQPAEDMGRIAGEIILRKIHNTKTKIYERIILEPKLEIKESSGYLRKHES